MQEMKEFCKRIVEIEKWKSLILLSRFLILFDSFISHFLVKFVAPNDRTGQINRFCKRLFKICKRVEDIKRGMFSVNVISNSSLAIE